MGDEMDAPTAVTITFPPQARLLRMARLTASAIATIGGADVEAIDDVKIAVDEVCASLIEAGDGSDLAVSFEVDGDSLQIVGAVTALEGSEPDASRFAMSRQILRAVAQRHELTTAAGQVRFSVTCSLQGPRDGA